MPMDYEFESDPLLDEFAKVLLGFESLDDELEQNNYHVGPRIRRLKRQLDALKVDVVRSDHLERADMLIDIHDLYSDLDVGSRRIHAHFEGSIRTYVRGSTSPSFNVRVLAHDPDMVSSPPPEIQPKNPYAEVAHVKEKLKDLSRLLKTDALRVFDGSVDVSNEVRAFREEVVYLTEAEFRKKVKKLESKAIELGGKSAHRLIVSEENGLFKLERLSIENPEEAYRRLQYPSISSFKVHDWVTTKPDPELLKRLSTLSLKRANLLVKCEEAIDAAFNRRNKDPEQVRQWEETYARFIGRIS
jgi:hypothetical protein